MRDTSPSASILAESLGQHLLAHASDALTQPREAHAAVLLQRLQDQHGPLIGDPSDDLPNQGIQLRINLLGRGRLGPTIER